MGIATTTLTSTHHNRQYSYHTLTLVFRRPRTARHIGALRHKDRLGQRLTRTLLPQLRVLLHVHAVQRALAHPAGAAIHLGEQHA